MLSYSTDNYFPPDNVQKNFASPCAFFTFNCDFHKFAKLTNWNLNFLSPSNSKFAVECNRNIEISQIPKKSFFEKKLGSLENCVF